MLLLAVGLGSLLGNLILAALGVFKRKARLLIPSVLLQSVARTLFSWLPCGMEYGARSYADWGSSKHISIS